MNKTTRKHGWPVAVALALGIIGALAVFVALSAQPGQVSYAQEDQLCDSALAVLLPQCQEPTATPEPTEEPTLTPPPTEEPTLMPPPTATPEPNQAPMTVGDLDDIEIVEGKTREVDVSGAFSDPDGDGLTYTAMSDNPFVAGTTIEGSVVTILGVGEGTATISVTASDGELDSPALTIAVTVMPEPNQAPVASGELDADEMFRGANQEVDVSEAFSDPDGDRLTYKAMSDNEMVATVAVSGSLVTVSAGQQIGTATITVTANDGESDSDPLTFAVMVINRAPMAVGELDDIAMIRGDEPISVDVSGAFSDLDGDELTYTAMSGNEAVATVAVSGSALEVSTNQRGGTATITVTANDGETGSASQRFKVMVTLSTEDRYDVQPAPDMLDKDDPAITIPEIIGRDGEKKYEKYQVIAPQERRRYDFEVSAVDENDGPLNEDATVTVHVNVTPQEKASAILRSATGFDSIIRESGDIELQGPLTIRARIDDGKRAFGLYVVCEEAGQQVDIDILDDGLNLVGETSIVCVAPAPEPPDPDEVSADCYAVTGHVDEMRNDERGVIANPEAPMPREKGDNTVEVLTGAKDVQLTVTVGTADECHPGPVYIRFRDRDGAFGTDIDEESAEAGVDVVGLDSQGKLELNLERELTADEAWQYDHYQLVIPGGDPAQARLAGKPGHYYQGSFRFFDPCSESRDPGYHFHVEVYENLGKSKVADEVVVCVPPEGIGPTELAVTVHTDRAGQATLRWAPVENADAYWVVVIEAATRTLASTPILDASPAGTLITGLMSGTEYHYAVVAVSSTEGGEAQYSANFITQTNTWADAS